MEKKKKEIKRNPRVISFKLLPSEQYLWRQYATNIGKSPSSLLISKVDRYLSLNPLEEDYDNKKIMDAVKNSSKFKQLIKIEETLTKNGKRNSSSLLTNISLRLNKDSLKEWDIYRQSRYLTRTALIRQTLDRFFEIKPKISIELEGNALYRLSIVINSLICEVGSIDFQRLHAIFGNKVDSSTLDQVLNKLEEEGTITRKGSWDNYVPTNPPENRGGSVMLGELLTRFI
ncbi:hypothetical protein DSAG12_00091 [Promethearchaeum syntrophicum]|uniref:Uncharacterized protein n=1 Tax=Promethearchaeum syntrophicum TaxID=2594042 RepID=A0A5B9D623_9ARCH|nr:hypothetical protein [Candidatus Prometheoarchaeum syntrophicum]